MSAAIVNRPQTWTVESREADVSIDILANPGSKQILLRFMPLCFQGNVPGYESHWRLRLDEAERLYKYLNEQVRRVLADAPNAYAKFDTSLRSQQIIFWTEESLNRFITAFGEAITYTKANPRHF